MTSAELVSSLADSPRWHAARHRRESRAVHPREAARAAAARAVGEAAPGAADGARRGHLDPAGQRTGDRARSGDARVGRHMGRARQRQRRSRNGGRQRPVEGAAGSAVVHAAARLADAGRRGGLLLRAVERRDLAAVPHRLCAPRVQRERLGSVSPRESAVCGRGARGSRPRTRDRVRAGLSLRAAAALLKDARPDIIVCQFWHIPWPNAEAFRVCPWGEQILHGLLGNDLLSFHIQFHCNNFLETVERTLEARVDYERFAVVRGGHATHVKPFAISIDPELWAGPAKSADRQAESRTIRRALGLGSERIIFGVDRLDYTKGIPDRIRAFERMLDASSRMARAGRPAADWRAEPRSARRATRRSAREVDEAVAQVNRAHGRPTGSRSCTCASIAGRRTSPRCTAPPTSASSRRCTTA